MTAVFGADEIGRYRPHLLLKAFGGEGQQALRAARLLVVGAGGLGSPAIAYLAAAGVGTLGVADDDAVALANLSRQILFPDAAVGRPKVESAGEFVRARNRHVTLREHRVRLGPDTATSLMGEYDFALDCTDSLPSRQVLAAAARSLGQPLVTGTAAGFDGQLTVFGPGDGDAGFADLFPDPVDESELEACETAGILGPVAGVIGTLMALEAIKLVAGSGTPLLGRLLLYEGLAARFTEIGYGPRRPGA